MKEDTPSIEKNIKFLLLLSYFTKKLFIFNIKLRKIILNNFIAYNTSYMRSFLAVFCVLFFGTKKAQIKNNKVFFRK